MPAPGGVAMLVFEKNAYQRDQRLRNKHGNTSLLL
jgi:hypothetical protein